MTRHEDGLFFIHSQMQGDASHVLDVSGDTMVRRTGPAIRETRG